MAFFIAARGRELAGSLDGTGPRWQGDGPPDHVPTLTVLR